MSTIAVKAYVEPDLARDIARVARAQGRSESSVIAEAIRTRFASFAAGPASAARDTDRRQLGRLEARVDKILRDQAMMKECVLLFVRIWLEHNPPIPEDLADSAAASAEARFHRFLDLLMKGLTPGYSIAEDVFGAKSGKDHGGNGHAETGYAGENAEATP
ncbi:MAG: CopG family transcriptional regulator [Caulobacteraceae bacterium]|nr:MAG: CopG family transcriptional regulator [Caulobacteraceae bacterium]